MRNITINIPEQYDDVIQFLISQKRVSNRSEAIRQAIQNFLNDEIDFYLKLEGFE